MDENHYEWQQEEKRIENIKRILSEKKNELMENNKELMGDILELRQGFWDDVTVNMDEPDEAIETYASIKQQAELLSERERSYGQFNKLVKLYERQEDSPYFGRIDFQEEDGEIESIYIGIGSLMDKNKEDFLIYDWRAPVSSMYYDYAPGPVQYETPVGEVTGEMKLKRQFIIRRGSLQGMFDTGLTIGDELLQHVLGGNATSHMKSIVATIQKEQNQIIRYDKNKMLIVQGAAGSGKTSAAMQRIAYLLYRYRTSISADQILLFSPNHMFISYVASVLPELGEDNMRQITFQEYAAGRLDRDFKLESPFEQLEYLLSDRDSQRLEKRVAAIRFKSALEYKNLLDDYVKGLTEKGMKFRNITFRGQTIVSAEEIHRYFYNLTGRIPNRIESVKVWLLDQLDAFQLKEQDKDWPVEEAAFLAKHEYAEAFNELEEHKEFNEDTFDDFDREQKLLVKRIVERKVRPLKKKIEQLKFIKLRRLYEQMFDTVSVPAELSEEDWKDIGLETKKALNNKYLYAEDVTPFLYLQDQVEGRSVNTVIRHLFIDEAQDYSPFQIEFIKQLFPNARFNLLGDYNQAIHNLYTKDPSLLEEGDELEEDLKVEHLYLMRSYRSTKPIVEFTKHLLPDGEKIEAFNREGQKPRVHKKDNEDELIKTMQETILSRQKEGHETIALLTRTKQEAKNLHERIGEKFSARLIYKESQSFEKGILILPGYLAKGIEFDAVMLPEVSSATYNKEEERKLLYTAATRAMHELDLFYTGVMSPLLQSVSEDLYERK
ncbi:DNA helicase-2 / ATP-dependent DNA helicase PcrA [Halobacillus alkaliphilus]|uniref:DNA 3'-5' helicase n=1 Tax=Halobacillus alkaliphilus TaxID=396056 RepID=A0A1I2QIM7_9BACI|nr:RNA polymerase recycling motor HelD [Halobacillus alkaliphilus]SFG27179.1 DNA helicase-2 / ATP-dependent DNA helicase PcrA [Halobacillus alkaliphilus]